VTGVQTCAQGIQGVEGAVGAAGRDFSQIGTPMADSLFDYLKPELVDLLGYARRP